MKTRKRLIEFYGFLRLVLGTGQLVALSAGYFLNEFVLKKPLKTQYHIFDQEILGLIFLAVFFRAIFHIVAGIGISLLRDWGREVITIGWPLMILETIGIIFVVNQQWMNDGLVASLGQSINWLGVLAYAAVVIFDYTFVSNFIQTFNESTKLYKDIGPSLQVKNVATVFVIAVLSFIILLYLGRPVKQGFHKGFYRASGQREVPTDQIKDLQIKTPKTTAVKETPAPSTENKIQAIYREKEAAPAPVMSEGTDKASPVSGVLKKEKREDEAGFSNVLIIGWSGAFMIIFGFVLLAKDLLEDLGRISAVGFVLLALGFGLWTLLGFMKGIFPLTFGALIASLINIGILTMQIKK